jgi:hypothetical protein
MASKISTNMKKPVLKVGKKFSLSGWMVFDGLALIIIVGVLAARFAGASVDSTFTRTPSEMNGGTLSRSVAHGVYRHIVAEGVHAEASTQVSAEEVAASRQICAQMRVNSADTFVDIQINGHYANKFMTSAGDVVVCADVNNESKGGMVYAGTSGDANVSAIYGVR